METDPPSRADARCPLRGVRIRRLRSEDRVRYIEFLGTLDPADLHLRTMGVPATAVDGESAIALAAVAPDGAILGLVRAALDASTASAAFALIVRSRLKRRGLGTALLRALLQRLGARGVRRVFGHACSRTI